MEFYKSPFLKIETRKKRIFFLKLFLYVMLFSSGKFLPAYSEFLQQNPSLSNIHSAILFLLGGNILISLTRLIFARLYLRKVREEKVHGNFLLGITWISNILNSVVFAIALMFAFDIRPLEFLTSLTIVAAAIAILTRDYVNNIINGLIIMFTDQFSLGDMIEVGGQKGNIEDITLLNTVIKREDGYLSIIPNNLLMSVQVTNFRIKETKDFSMDFELSLEKDQSLESLKFDLGKLFENEIKAGEISELKISLSGINKEVAQYRLFFKCKPDDLDSLSEKVQEFLLKLSQNAKSGELL